MLKIIIVWLYTTEINSIKNVIHLNIKRNIKSIENVFYENKLTQSEKKSFIYIDSMR